MSHIVFVGEPTIYPSRVARREFDGVPTPQVVTPEKRRAAKAKRKARRAARKAGR
jgi:hypothetical protein